jgi:hypothetical protein
MSYGEVYFAEKTMNARLEERHHQVDARRLASQLLGGSQRGKRFFSGALAWLGHCLVDWGSRLQERYSAAAPTPQPQPANRLAG